MSSKYYNENSKSSSGMNPKQIVKLALIGVCMIVIMILMITIVEFKTVRGGELGIKETWSDGVVEAVLPPKNYWLFPGFSQEIITYDATLLVYQLADYTVRSSDNQDMTISSKVQWRRDPAKLVHHHKTFGNDAEKRAIQPAMISAIIKSATTNKAIDAYSGEGLIAMQTAIQNELLNNVQLKNDGIVIESFIIQENKLNHEYVAEITGRQLAALRQTRAIEEQKAAEAEALVAKSKAQSDLNKQVVEAERDKQVMVLKAEAENERAVLAAKAEQQKLTLEAEGKKMAMIAEAEGTKALGEAKAAANKALLESYAVQGSDSFTKIEISKSIAQAYQGIKGYLPDDLKINVMTEDFYKAMDAATGNLIVPVAPHRNPPAANTIK